jgi:hypothetical protein
MMDGAERNRAETPRNRGLSLPRRRNPDLDPGRQPTIGEETELAMAKLRILSHLGDTSVDWDIRKAEVGDPEALEAIREAERIFEEHKAKGATAFRVEPGKQAEKLERFDKTSEQIIMVPRIAGG